MILDSLLDIYEDIGYNLRQFLLPANRPVGELNELLPTSGSRDLKEVWGVFDGTIYPEMGCSLADREIFPGFLLLGFDESKEEKRQLEDFKDDFEDFKFDNFWPVLKDQIGGVAGVDVSTGEFAFFEGWGDLISRKFSSLGAFFDEYIQLIVKENAITTSIDEGLTVLDVADGAYTRFLSPR